MRIAVDAMGAIMHPELVKGSIEAVADTGYQVTVSRRPAGHPG